MEEISKEAEQPKLHRKSVLIGADASSSRACLSTPSKTLKISTVHDYQLKFRSLVRWAEPNAHGLEFSERLYECIPCLRLRAKNWKPATTRSYTAALRWKIQETLHAGVLDEAEAARLLALIDLPQEKLLGRQPARTSALKRKFLNQHEYTSLLTQLSMIADQGGRGAQTALLTYGLVRFGCVVGARPTELRTARIVGQALTLASAKRHANYGFADERVIDLVGLPSRAIAEFETFLNAYQLAGAEAGCWQTLHERLSKCLRNACVACGIAPVALYTLRHQASANAKRHLTSEQVAAFMGHSDPLSGRYYAPRSKGWRSPILILPAPQTMQAFLAHMEAKSIEAETMKDIDAVRSYDLTNAMSCKESQQALSRAMETPAMVSLKKPMGARCLSKDTRAKAETQTSVGQDVAVSNFHIANCPNEGDNALGPVSKRIPACYEDYDFPQPGTRAVDPRAIEKHRILQLEELKSRSALVNEIQTIISRLSAKRQVDEQVRARLNVIQSREAERLSSQ